MNLLLRFLLFFTFFPAIAGTYHVGKKFGTQTIQQTINQASDGDTILVEPGIYHEKNLLVNKAIVLKGINFPVLDGESKYEIISIKSNGLLAL